MIPLGRFTPRFSRTLMAQRRRSRLPIGREYCDYMSTISNRSVYPYEKVGFGQESLMRRQVLHSSGFQWFRSGSDQENKTGAAEAAASDLESDLSREDLVKVAKEKERILMSKQEELENMKDKVLRTFAEMENVKDRTRRESENAKKFAIQNFAKGLLDVADNLGRASDAAKTSFSKIDEFTDTAVVVQQLKVLLEGVEMTEKQLTEVFKKFGLERYDPVDEEFDPNRHNAVFQVPDASKPADHVAIVLKAGYMLHDRVIRPAEVGVAVAMKGEQGSES